MEARGKPVVKTGALISAAVSRLILPRFAEAVWLPVIEATIVFVRVLTSTLSREMPSGHIKVKVPVVISDETADTNVAPLKPRITYLSVNGNSELPSKDPVREKDVVISVADGKATVLLFGVE